MHSETPTFFKPLTKSSPSHPCPTHIRFGNRIMYNACIMKCPGINLSPNCSGCWRISALHGFVIGRRSRGRRQELLKGTHPHPQCQRPRERACNAAELGPGWRQRGLMGQCEPHGQVLLCVERQASCGRGRELQTLNREEATV